MELYIIIGAAYWYLSQVLRSRRDFRRQMKKHK